MGYLFNVVDGQAVDSGRRGGRAQSKAKVAAARRNGKSGGRPPTHTLAERIFGRRLRMPRESTKRNARQSALGKAVDSLLQGERQELEEYFGVSSLKSPEPYDTVLFRKRDRHPRKRIKYLIQKFRHAFEYHAGLKQA
jgi:hypothetical protein